MNKPTLVRLESIPVIGYEYRTSLNDEGHYKDIPAFYQDFGRHERFASIPAKRSPGMSYGIACRFEDDGGFSFIVGEQVEEDAAAPGNGYTREEIPAGQYAEFKAYGPASLVQETREYIYGTWLPNSNYERREGPDFEVTDVMNSCYPDDLRIKIYIPVD